MNLKPFNLEEALAGKPVVTRDGRKVTEIYHFKTALNDTQNVLAVIDKNVFPFTKDGKYWSSGQESTADLFMAPESIDVWVNVWKDIENKPLAVTCLSKEEVDADKSQMFDYTFIKTEKITIEL